jgi:hypothetical protein
MTRSEALSVRVIATEEGRVNNSWMACAVEGELVAAEDIASAVVAGLLRYGDGATQVFRPDGSTTYTENGHETRGEWSLEGGRFCSFWPPSYRACYDLRWIVENGDVIGLRFDDGGAQFDGRYEK